MLMRFMAQLSRQTSLSRGKPVDGRQAIEKLNHFQGHKMAAKETICCEQDIKHTHTDKHTHTHTHTLDA